MMDKRYALQCLENCLGDLRWLHEKCYRHLNANTYDDYKSVERTIERSEKAISYLYDNIFK